MYNLTYDHSLDIENIQGRNVAYSDILVPERKPYQRFSFFLIRLLGAMNSATQLCSEHRNGLIIDNGTEVTTDGELARNLDYSRLIVVPSALAAIQHLAESLPIFALIKQAGQQPLAHHGAWPLLLINSFTEPHGATIRFPLRQSSHNRLDRRDTENTLSSAEKP